MTENCFWSTWRLLTAINHLLTTREGYLDYHTFVTHDFPHLPFSTPLPSTPEQQHRFQLLPSFSHTQCNPDLTFSSPEATLEANSMTQPTAMRAAPDECSSFQMVSLSTWANSQHRGWGGGREREREYKRKQISEGGLAGWQPMYNNISLPSWPAEKAFWTWLCLYFFSTLTSPIETHSCHASLPFPV